LLHGELYQPYLYRVFSESKAYVLGIVIGFLSLAVFMTAFLFFLTRKERVTDWRAFFKVERLDIRGIWLCFGLGVLLQTLNAAFLWNFVLKPVRDFLSSLGLSGSAIGLGTGGTVPALAPNQAILLTVFLLVFWWLEVPEELFFRGYLQNKFQSIVGKNTTAVISAIVWDLAHLWGLVNILERFLYGLLYGFIFRLRQNTTPTMIVHPIGNRSLLLAVIAPQIWGVTISPTSPSGILLLLGINAALIVLITAIWRFLRSDRGQPNRRKDTEKTDVARNGSESTGTGQGTPPCLPIRGRWGVNSYLMKTATQFWLIEILISGFNFFVLMNLVYEPRWGNLIAHQIGMSTRIAYIFVIAFFLLRTVKKYETRDLFHVGILWLGLTLLFEWGGSFIIRRPVEEIVIGWNIFAGYMWPYVLLTYFSANLIVGTVLHPGKKRMGVM